MRFAPGQAHLDCAALAHASDADQAARTLAEQALSRLRRQGFVVFRIGRLRLGDDHSRALGRLLAAALRTALVEDGAPARLRLEFDRPQVTYVPDGHEHRTLLPHHDGQHCSYLTPSLLDDPDWRPEWRTFGGTGYTTTPEHKIYQGIFIADPGEALSVTTYYDWLGILRTVHAARTGQAATDISAVAGWVGANLRRALRRQADHGCAYPSIGDIVGLTDPMWDGVSFHHGEEPLSATIRERHPGLAGIAGHCPCGACVGETARLFCHHVLAATDHNWRQWRHRWEVLVPSERFDLVFGENLTMLHGGWAGGPGRVIEPICLVVDTPEGSDYERWLASAWRSRG